MENKINFKKVWEVAIKILDLACIALVAVLDIKMVVLTGMGGFAFILMNLFIGYKLAQFMENKIRVLLNKRIELVQEEGKAVLSQFAEDYKKYSEAAENDIAKLEAEVKRLHEILDTSGAK
jgi:hypothetical protein